MLDTPRPHRENKHAHAHRATAPVLPARPPRAERSSLPLPRPESRAVEGRARRGVEAPEKQAYNLYATGREKR